MARPNHTERVASLPAGEPKAIHRDPETLRHLRNGLIVLMGSCGSGKSTFAEAVWGRGFIVDVTAHTLAYGDPAINPTARYGGFADAYRAVELRLARKQTTVFDSTGVTARVRASCRALALQYRVPAHLLVIDTPQDVAAKRNSERTKKVPDEVLAGIRTAYAEALSMIEREAWDSVTILSMDAEARLLVAGKAAR